MAGNDDDSEEISLKNGRLIQKPVREIEKYHANMVRYSDEVVSGRRSLEGISGRSLDVTFVITGNKYSRFTVNLAKEADIILDLYMTEKII